jgi:hypothetical protein
MEMKFIGLLTIALLATSPASANYLTLPEPPQENGTLAGENESMRVTLSEDSLRVQSEGTIKYIAGGIGQSEIDALHAVRQDYNFHLMNSNQAGQFSGDTRILVNDANDNLLLDVTNSGPIFYAKLPNGKYSVEAINKGSRDKKSFSITHGKTTNIHFVWRDD